MRLILPLFAALLLTGCDLDEFGQTDRFKEDFHYTLKPTDRLSVENFNGSVEIAGWDEPTIEVTGVKYASTEDRLKELKVEVHETGSLTEFRTYRTSGFYGNQGARYVIRAPRKTLVDRVVSSNGTVRVHDMTGAARVRTSNGAIRMENVSGGVVAETSNGAIELDMVKGGLSLKTSNGRIEANEITGQCEAETSNGPVTLRYKDGPDGPMRIHTSNGSVEVTMVRSPKDTVRMETSNGAIRLNLPKDAAVRMDAHTSQSISSDFEILGNLSDRDKHHLEGNIGPGGPLVELRTSNGGINIRKASENVN